MSNLIVKHWQARTRRLPGIDCICRPDGAVTILSCRSQLDPGTGERTRFCTPLCDTTIDSLEGYGAAWWTAVDPWTEIPWQGGRLLGGDGGMGSQGHIACVDAHDNLVWAMFFEETNPIRSLEVQGRQLVAVNEHGELQITINLDRLTEIRMMPIATDT